MSQVLNTVKTTALTSEESKAKVDAYILDVLTKKMTQSVIIHPNYKRLWQTILTLYGAGGKRLRPYMTLLMYQAYSNDSIEKVIPAAAAQELLHQAMLMHDDIIDRDTIRYNIKNVSGQYVDTYGDLLADSAEVRHFADSTAILAGDLLISEAHLQLASIDADRDLLRKAQELLNQAIFHVAGGELLDTEATFEQEGIIDPITIAEQKTASYSFIGPLMIGAVLGGASEQQQILIRQIGTAVGIAYQLRDDLMGVFGDEEVTGKSADGDIREGKRTLLIDEFYKRASEADKQTFGTIFKNAQASHEQINEVRILLESTGAKQAIEASIEKYRYETLQNLENLTIDQPHREMLAGLIAFSLERDK